MEPRRAAPEAPSWGPPGAAGPGTVAELVYHLAGALGTELQELARRFGPEAAAGLVPLVVRALELLEQAAVGPAPDSVSALLAQRELRRLREENERLRWELSAGPQEERELLRQLKEVTDRQRDELRAHSRDLRQRGQETEALQEQLQRLLLVNAELRQKLAAVQTQLRAAQDRETERQQPGGGAAPPAEERARGQAGGPGHQQGQEPEPATPEDPAEAAQPPGRPREAGQCRFSREEFEQILQERNELKATAFLLKEELAYFQRELLTDHRVPGLLLEAMKVAVRKQRKKIKAKMLGTPDEAESSDDEDGSWLLLADDKNDHPPPPESKIQSFFGLWYRGKAESPEDETHSPAPGKPGGEEETQPQSPAPELPYPARQEHLCLGASAAPEA
ncbi:rab-interacting lysosomal protein isoform X2 [Sapajus apella]|uniref:Rab-interacting lysosomal protein n=1 Tax=Sapajus apella TaxID=9515 RepID=A0A6J3GMS6_SAPAP|nr:rab-interacting lysosomal protein isoform X2 [Sapajus apella]